MVKEQTKLKEILKERKISVYRLAVDCKIATPDMYMTINGKKPMYPKWKKKISEYLNLPEEEIFDDIYKSKQYKIIEDIVRRFIFPLLDEYDIGLWERIDYIELADKWVEIINKNWSEEEHDDVLIKDLCDYIAAELQRGDEK